VLHRLLAELAKDADFEDLYLDSTIIRAHQHAAGALKKKVAKRWANLAEVCPARCTRSSTAAAT
jgi:hypothetical protein